MEKSELIQEEHEILAFWEEHQCFQKLKAQAKGKPLFRFLDGPITANNPMGVHHAWGRSLKDIFIRYKFRRGYDCRCQNGFDAQGLWVEVGVEKELGFTSKRDIEAFGLGEFTETCKARVRKFAGVITEQSKRLGQWMDWGNDYFTNTDENIEGIWYFLKQCHEQGWLRQEHKPMPWCPRCGTSLSEHEMTGSYQQMTHESVFFQLPLKNLPGERSSLVQECAILVWTTTPWTLSSNVALAVNPEMEYALVRLNSQKLPVILAKSSIKQLGDDKLEVLGCCKGADLVGLQYETCFPELPALINCAHRIVAWDEVDAAEGTGVVHIAPGCGAEDFQLGLREGLEQVMPVDDLGVFLEGFGFFSGKNSKNIQEEVFQELKKRGKLYQVRPHEHSYPICWRCKTPVIFRLVPAWYISTEELRPRLISAARTVRWEPASAGRRMEDWLENMGDWNISRKRYYGLPLPFYPCSCGELTVVESRQKLEDLAGKRAKELHRPWVDELSIACPKCGQSVNRIPDTGDVWLDAGIVPFSTTGYFQDRETWLANFPAEWVTEMNEQVRLWFYSMLFMSVVLEDRAPYEHVMCYSTVVNEDGGKFSKTGFMIQFDEAAEEIGADAIRYLYAGNPMANDVRFGFGLGEEARRKLLSFRNIFSFFMTYFDIDHPDLTEKIEETQLCVMDQWLLLRTNQLIARATAAMEAYRASTLVKEFNDFLEDVSNWYVRLNRRRFWKSGEKADKQAAYLCLYFSLKSAVQVMAPVIPFQTEMIWQKLVRKAEPDAPISVHGSPWPEEYPGKFSVTLLDDTAFVREIIATALRLRNESGHKVRQPLSAVKIVCDEAEKSKILGFEEQILAELNVQTCEFLEDSSSLQERVPVVNFKEAGAVLKSQVNAFKAHLMGLSADEAEEVVRQILEKNQASVPGWEGALPAKIFQIQEKSKPNIVSSGACGERVVVALDIHLTESLKRTGAVRDLTRQIQILRKEAGFSVDQRIELAIITSSCFLQVAFEEGCEGFMREVLAEKLYKGERICKPFIERDVRIFDETVTLQLCELHKNI